MSQELSDVGKELVRKLVEFALEKGIDFGEVKVVAKFLNGKMVSCKIGEERSVDKNYDRIGDSQSEEPKG